MLENTVAAECHVEGVQESETAGRCKEKRHIVVLEPELGGFGRTAEEVRKLDGLGGLVEWKHVVGSEIAIETDSVAAKELHAGLAVEHLVVQVIVVLEHTGELEQSTDKRLSIRFASEHKKST